MPCCAPSWPNETLWKPCTHAWTSTPFPLPFQLGFNDFVKTFSKWFESSKLLLLIFRFSTTYRFACTACTASIGAVLSRLNQASFALAFLILSFLSFGPRAILSWWRLLCHISNYWPWCHVQVVSLFLFHFLDLKVCCVIRCWVEKLFLILGFG